MIPKSGALLSSAEHLKRVLDEIDRTGPAVKRSQIARSQLREVDLAVTPEARTELYLTVFSGLTYDVESYLKIRGRAKKASTRRKTIYERISTSLTKIILMNATARRDRGGSPSDWARLDETLTTILSASVVRPEFNNLYVLGCFERKKTLLTQQQRAILLTTGILKFWSGSKAPRIAVIGGGVAGVTAYATLLRGGADVHLFERASDLMHLQRHNTTRYLHPHLYDWPMPGSENPVSDLPFMNWSAGYSFKVVAQLDVQLEKIIEAYGGAPPRTNCTVDEIELERGSRKYTIAAEDHQPESGFDVVIVAIGFGVEIPQTYPVDIRSYWDNHPIHSVGRFSAANPGRILVSGCGDGALVDILRATFKKFEHQKILKLVPELSDPEIRNRLLQIESEAESHRVTMDSDSFLFSTEYEQLLSHVRISEAVKKRVATSFDVTFNSSRIGKFKLGTSILNRVLVHLMLSNGLVSFRQGSVVEINQIAESPVSDPGFQVKWKKKSAVYDSVVLRYGVGQARHFKSHFPDIYAAGEAAFDRIANLQIRSEIPSNLGELLDECRSGWET
ncbi:FAD-dependent oxidoreductase [Hyphomonas sp. KY3]|uniref:FAD-dependent oxidoreductase n=1 Tax=Hyphomonas sp. KY3 TaxID=2016196 RepID=UPI001A8DC157|nr:FAD-dependent oxidoreductase [Hyphomonas sp. KY3]QSR23100.1 hypothetical protein CFA77_12435 [Hyphomonas sp. KY3]